MKEKPKLSKLSKALNEKNEYEIIRAEELRRNKDYRKDALKVKNEPDNHWKRIKERGTYTSDAYNAFCDKWNLTHHPDRFLDPDITVEIKGSPWADSPHAHVRAFLPQSLKPKPDMLYLEVGLHSTLQKLLPLIEDLLSAFLKKNSVNLESRKENLKIYDLKESGLSFDKIAARLAIELPSNNKGTTAGALVKSRYYISKKHIKSFS